MARASEKKSRYDENVMKRQKKSEKKNNSSETKTIKGVTVKLRMLEKMEK